jgi:predicted lysophospholipase L1 biosynthesis ABC-type transport system permease subunit
MFFSPSGRSISPRVQAGPSDPGPPHIISLLRCPDYAHRRPLLLLLLLLLLVVAALALALPLAVWCAVVCCGVVVLSLLLRGVVCLLLLLVLLSVRPLSVLYYRVALLVTHRTGGSREEGC